MKNKLFGLILCLVSSLSIAQSVLNAITPDQLRKERSEKFWINEIGDTVSTDIKPLPYGYIEEKDIIWSKIVWEIIDFNERINQPYYLAGDELIQNNKSMYDVLIEGIRKGEITQVFDDEYFENKMSYDQIMARAEKKDTQQFYYDMVAAGEKPDEGAVFNYKIDAKDIKMIKTKGMWYIDRRLGEMKYRLLGLSIMGPDAQSLGTQFSDGAFVDLFWIWYPDARNVLFNVKVFNPSNSSSSISFDEMLNARRFSSIIYKTQTSNGIKSVDQYIPKDSKSQLEEHHRIKNSILQAESDMWNY